MDAVSQVRRIFQHNAWADDRIGTALRAYPENAAPLREYAHILGAEAVWLARILNRPATVAVWPTLSLDEAESLRLRTAADLAGLLEGITAEQLDAPVSYVNSAGQAFVNTLGDILTHLALHGQYHRGKVNLLLRQAGLEPAPTDFISFVRGVPAATEASARRKSSGAV